MLRLVMTDGVMERSAPEAISRVGIGAIFQEVLDNLAMPLRGREMKRCPPV